MEYGKGEKKMVNSRFGEHYLLGVHDGREYWLEKPSWDCGWYWGFGYVEAFTNRVISKARDIAEHTHFDSLFMRSGVYPKGAFELFFQSTPLSENEVWKLTELMKSAYIARHYSDMLHTGGAHQTQNPCADIIKSDEEYKRINEVVLPSIFEEVKKLLTEGVEA